MNFYFTHETYSVFWSRHFWTKNFFAPFFIGMFFICMGSYFQVYEENKQSNRIISFGLVIFLLGCCCVILSICWCVYEYNDSQEMIIRSQTRANLPFFTDISSNLESNRLYGYYSNSRLNVQRRISNPPTYSQAVQTDNNLNETNNYLKNPTKLQNKLNQLSVSNLQTLLPPSYEEAIKMNELNKSFEKNF